jgi:flagellar motor switch protein FliG
VELKQILQNFSDFLTQTDIGAALLMALLMAAAYGVLRFFDPR